MSIVEEIARPESADAAEAAENRSLIDDVEVLIEDGKTYLEAELNYQKTRAAFAGDRAKGVALYALVALIFAWMALIGLTIGLIFALSPAIGPWAATGVVVILWLIVAGVAGAAAAKRWRQLASSFASEEQQP